MRISNDGVKTQTHSIHDLVQGRVFRFVKSSPTQVYQMSDREMYQSLATGAIFDVDTCCEGARVVLYPDAEINLGLPERE